MKVTTQLDHELSVDVLAKALAGATVKEFKEFWEAFGKEVNDEALDKFAKAIYMGSFGRTSDPIRKLAKLVDYYEVESSRSV